jgi:hypothetical protein
MIERSLLPALAAAVARPERREWPANSAGSKPASRAQRLTMSATLCSVSRDGRILLQMFETRPDVLDRVARGVAQGGELEPGERYANGAGRTSPCGIRGDGDGATVVALDVDEYFARALLLREIEPESGWGALHEGLREALRERVDCVPAVL